MLEAGDAAYFDAGTPQFIHQQNLVRILARQSVRRMNVNAIHGAIGHGVAQTLQCRPDQGRAAVAFVDEAQFTRNGKPVLHNTLLQR